MGSKNALVGFSKVVCVVIGVSCDLHGITFNQELQAVIHGKDEEIEATHRELTNKDHLIANKDRDLATKDEQIATIQRELFAKAEELGIKNAQIEQQQYEIEVKIGLVCDFVMHNAYIG